MKSSISVPSRLSLKIFAKYHRAVTVCEGNSNILFSFSDRTEPTK